MDHYQDELLQYSEDAEYDYDYDDEVEDAYEM